LANPTPALSGEVESGVLLPILARRISRTSVVVGKALGLAAVLGLYGGIAGLLEALVVRVATGYVPPHPLAAIVALCMLSLVILTFTLALSARLPALASSIVSVTCFGVAWIVGIVAAFGAPYHNEALVRIGVVSQLLFPSDAMWRVAAYQLEPAALIHHGGPFGPLGPFSVTSPPPTATIVWTIGWVAAALFLATRSFESRDI
jgi:ABC-type transport system involved in multi-copper enzyme maturation permease subunit